MNMFTSENYINKMGRVKFNDQMERGCKQAFYFELFIRFTIK